MYVCICHAISDQDIRRAVAQGADSFEDLQARTGCASCCGCCEQDARVLFDANLAAEQRITSLQIAA